MTVAFAVLFGLALGSFANAAIDRVPRHASLTGRSACDSCGVGLRARDLVPVLSYVMLRGRCASCSTPIGIRTPFVEVACAITFVAAFSTLPVVLAAAASAAFVATVVGAGVVVASSSRRRMVNARKGTSPS
jgi:leader peptidase (prepilin peptidase)/N-methyltransferase